jgi:acetyl-CoA carboxylase biotin carboxyl carrier protein
MKLEEIRFLAKIMEESGLTGLEVSSQDGKIRLEKRPPAPVPAPLPAAASGGVPAAIQECGTARKTAEGPHYKEIKSPMVGVFYTAPTPESEPYVKVGSTVKKGDVLCVIEAMKLMNEINSDQDGEIAEICAENGSVVEYGQTLFKLR